MAEAEVPHDRDLVGAVLAVAGELELVAVLERFVEAAAGLTGAPYGALTVIDDSGVSTAFVSTGVPGTVADVLRAAPLALGTLGEVPETGALRLSDAREHPAFRGIPPHHPSTVPLLGTSVRVGGRVFGHLYLSEKPGGFTQQDEESVVALAAAAGVAVANAHLYADALRREHWLRAGQDLTTTLLEGVDDDDALERIVATAREADQADAAALALPGVGGELVIEVAVGRMRRELLGAPMPPGSRAWRVIEEGTGLITASLARASTVATPALRSFGPGLFAPVPAPGGAVGVLILLRKVGAPPFEPSDLTTAASFAAQAGLANELAAGRHAQDLAALLDERERIARDLHDLAIQQLFATGLQLETVRRRAAGGTDAAGLTGLIAVVDEALDNVDGSVRQIRRIVHDLRDPDAATGLVARLRREASLARTGLGFAPSFVVSLDGATVAEGTLDADRLDGLVGPGLTSDVVAVVREGLANAARHARASSVTVRVRVVGAGPQASVRVEVEDDGVGLAPDRRRSSGTRNLAERAHEHGGTAEIGTRPEGPGTLLTWTAPLG
ncbi:GAF domain-containing sensor histidine kinase [Cellulomonas sp. P5_C5]